MVAVFDTVFHRTIPDRAALYPFPPEISIRQRIRRYGFPRHLSSLPRPPLLANRRMSLESVHLVTLHLEGGSSAAAIQQGQSIDTSMGFTPFEGLMMGTRCGDIDPVFVPYLMRKENMTAKEVEVHS